MTTVLINYKWNNARKTCGSPRLRPLTAVVDCAKMGSNDRRSSGAVSFGASPGRWLYHPVQRRLLCTTSFFTICNHLSRRVREGRRQTGGEQLEDKTKKWKFQTFRGRLPRSVNDDLNSTYGNRNNNDTYDARVMKKTLIVDAFNLK